MWWKSWNNLKISYFNLYYLIVVFICLIFSINCHFLLIQQAKQLAEQSRKAAADISEEKTSALSDGLEIVKQNLAQVQVSLTNSFLNSYL